MTTDHPQPHLIYHADDLDGRGSAAIALRALYPEPDLDDEVAHDAWIAQARSICHPVSYNQPLPDLPAGCPVVLLDFSFEPPAMLVLAAAHPLTYIDHHAPRIRDLEAAGLFPRLHAMQLNAGDGPPAAILLSFFHFQPDSFIPASICYLSDYDALPGSARSGSAWTDCILPYQHGLRSYPTDPWDEIWLDVLDEADAAGLIAEGEAILRSRAQTAALFGPRSCYLTEPWKWIRQPVLAGNGVSEDYFPHHVGYWEAEILLSYRYEPTCTPPNQWKCTIWPGPAAPPDFDCGTWAKDNYGGGGHRGCAGFHLATHQLPIP